MTEHKDWDNAFRGKELRGTVEHAPSFGGALSFMRRKYTRDLEGVDVAVTGIPLDTATSNRPGARFGPRAIRAASTIISWTRPWPWERWKPTNQSRRQGGHCPDRAVIAVLPRC